MGELRERMAHEISELRERMAKLEGLLEGSALRPSAGRVKAKLGTMNVLKPVEKQSFPNH